jgi:hypothetical protein
MRVSFSIAAVAMAIAGCASSANDIKPTYVSPLTYQPYTCQQLALEADRVSRRASEVAGVQDSKASSDTVATGIAIVLFWPAAFMVKGDGPTAAELARLKGEYETLEKVSIEKNCNIKFAKPAPTPAAGTPADGEPKPRRARPPRQE